MYFIQDYFFTDSKILLFALLRHKSHFSVLTFEGDNCVPTKRLDHRKAEVKKYLANVIKNRLPVFQPQIYCYRHPVVFLF